MSRNNRDVAGTRGEVVVIGGGIENKEIDMIGECWLLHCVGGRGRERGRKKERKRERVGGEGEGEGREGNRVTILEKILELRGIRDFGSGIGI